MQCWSSMFQTCHNDRSIVKSVMWGMGRTRDLTATQRVYDVVRSNSPDTGTAMYYLDYACAPICPDSGPGLSMNPQFWGFDALRSYGTANYH